jgi:hypothetical protein
MPEVTGSITRIPAARESSGLPPLPSVNRKPFPLRTGMGPIAPSGTRMAWPRRRDATGCRHTRCAADTRRRSPGRGDQLGGHAHLVSRAVGWGCSAVSENLSLTGEASLGIRARRGSDASQLPSDTSGQRSRTSPAACATGTCSACNPEESYPGPPGTRQPSATSHRACPYLGLRPVRAPGSPGILTISERTVVLATWTVLPRQAIDTTAPTAGQSRPGRGRRGRAGHRDHDLCSARPAR